MAAGLVAEGKGEGDTVGAAVRVGVGPGDALGSTVLTGDAEGTGDAGGDG